MLSLSSPICEGEVKLSIRWGHDEKITCNEGRETETKAVLMGAVYKIHNVAVDSFIHIFIHSKSIFKTSGPGLRWE